MLLEEIKANLSSDEEASSDDESDEGKKKRGKQNEHAGDDGEHQKAPGKKCCRACLNFKDDLGKLLKFLLSTKKVIHVDR